MEGSFFAAAMVARKLARVPPDQTPFMPRTRPLTRLQGAPVRSMACCCRKNTPRSKGMESNPQENTMRAPLLLAASPWASIICCIQLGSPQRST